VLPRSLGVRRLDLIEDVVQAALVHALEPCVGAAGKVDGVVVYKVDRLSRSLLDFARLMEAFEKKRVAFVSVTRLSD
jgi:DNA invertase Pin-like site-specific DNA recombinase